MLPLRPFTNRDAPSCCVDLLCIIAASEPHSSLTLTEGALVCTEGQDDGCADEGFLDGSPDGCPDGSPDGTPEGFTVGLPVGSPEGCPEGWHVG